MCSCSPGPGGQGGTHKSGFPRSVATGSHGLVSAGLPPVQPDRAPTESLQHSAPWAGALSARAGHSVWPLEVRWVIDQGRDRHVEGTGQVPLQVHARDAGLCMLTEQIFDF